MNILFLMNLYRSIIVVFDFHIEKLLSDAKVLHVELLGEQLFDPHDVILIFAGNNEVIDVEGNISLFIFIIGVDKNAGIRVTLFEVESDEYGHDFEEPCS